jgi:anti-anti-sigma factor
MVNMSVRTSTLSGGVALLSAEGSFVGMDKVDELREAVSRVVSSENPRLIIDLSKVTYLSSMAIGELIRTHITYTRRNWEFAVSGIKDKVFTIFEITKLTKVLNIQDTLDHAEQSFK